MDIRDKISKLLALADSPNEHEAKLDDRELVQEGYRDGQKFNLSHVIEEDTNEK